MRRSPHARISHLRRQDRELAPSAAHSPLTGPQTGIGGPHPLGKGVAGARSRFASKAAPATLVTTVVRWFAKSALGPAGNRSLSIAVIRPIAPDQGGLRCTPGLLP